MNKQGQDMMLSFYVVIISFIILGAMLIFFTGVKTFELSSIEKQEQNFCLKKDITISGEYKFCNGKPFACNTEKCDYIQLEVKQ